MVIKHKSQSISKNMVNMAFRGMKRCQRYIFNNFFCHNQKEEKGKKNKIIMINFHRNIGAKISIQTIHTCFTQSTNLQKPTTANVDYDDERKKSWRNIKPLEMELINTLCTFFCASSFKQIYNIIQEGCITRQCDRTITW